MDEQNRNLILATGLSLLVIIVWFVLFPPPEPENLEAQPAPAAASEEQEINLPETATGAAGPPATLDTDAEATEAPRVQIATDRLEGSISLLGGRLDDLQLTDYRQSLDSDADVVSMLSPAGGDKAYYALYGWAPGAGLDPAATPGPSTLWSIVEGDVLTPSTPVTLGWDNGAGLSFFRQISVDENYMFSITQSVRNTSAAAVVMAPYGIIARHGLPDDLKNFFILHEGAIYFAEDEFGWAKYNNIDPYAERENATFENAKWTGFTDHYWQSVIIAEPESTFKIETFHDTDRDIFQTTAKHPTLTLAAGDSVSISTRFFAGAKEWETIRTYQDDGVVKFIDSIDWGWFFFLTKPIFWLLHELNKLIGNMGWAIIGLTLIIKAVLFPLAYKSYVSMAKMKELQPEMEKLKEQAGEDRQKLQQGMMELYKKEKVNPAAGCLPILLQIPIFFSLYKVIFVTIELRHAPWFGPFQDLSAPDPTSLLNVFGLFPWMGPEPGSIMALIFLGILPLLLGISMWLQQKLNPAPTDPTQQMIFAWMPWMFMFMLGSFASGLIVYWIANNTITFVQQYTIMRSQGYTPDILGNILSSFKKGATEEKK